MSDTKRNAWIPNFGAKGWGVTFTCILFYFLYVYWTATSNTLYGIFEESYGWSMTEVSFAISLGGWFSVASVALFGAISKKTGAKIVSLIGLLGCALSFVLIALTSSLLVFTIGVVLFFVFMAAFAIIGLGTLGSSWFPRTKGVFMGIATLGMTIGTAALNPILLALVPAVGLAGFFFISAAFCAVTAILVAVLVKNNPEEAGAYPDNDTSVSREDLSKEFQLAADYKKNSPWKLSKVLATPQTWLIGIGWGITMMVANGIMAMFVPTIASFGHDFMLGVILLSSMWPVGLIGHYLIGVIDLKIGTKKTTIIVVIIEALAGAIIFFLGTSEVACAIGAGMFMFAISGNANVCMSMTTTVFGRQDFENAWPAIQVIYSVLSFAGVVILALFAGAFGQQSVLLVSSIFCIVALVPIALCSSKQIASNIQD
jgi:MFS family permease